MKYVPIEQTKTYTELSKYNQMSLKTLKIIFNQRLLDCEYLKKYEGYQFGYTFSHKGNCKNPIHYQIIHDTIYYKIQ